MYGVRAAIGAMACVVAYGATAHAQEQAFPRCELEARPRAVFLEHYAAGHLAIAEANFEQARERLGEALSLCMDDEVVWFLARVHERLGDQAMADRLDETWRAQRELHDLPLDAPKAPSWVKAPSSGQQNALAARTLELEDVEQKINVSGTYPIPLPSVYKHPEVVAPVTVGAYPRAATLARLSVQVVPVTGASLWLSDGTFLGNAPLEEVMIPARADLLLVLKVNGEQVLVRTVRAEPRTHQRLFITVPE